MTGQAIVMILLGIAGVFSIDFGWRYRTGRTRKPYFLHDKSTDYALLGIPFGISFLSLSIDMLIWFFLPETNFLTNLSRFLLAIGMGVFILGLILSFFPNSFVYPGWVKWLEQNHKDISGVLREEVKAIGMNDWAKKVQTQEDLGKWIAEVRHNHENGTLLSSHKKRELARANKKKELQKNKQKYLKEALQRGLDGPGAKEHILLTIKIPTEDGLRSISSGYYLPKKKENVPLDELQNCITKFISLLDKENNLDYLIYNWPMLVAGGGELVPFLLSVVEQDDDFVTQVVLTQLLGHISRDTTSRLSYRFSSLLCDHCFTRYSSHETYLSWINTKITYYGCRSCGRSRKFIKHVDKVVAVLDDQRKKRHHFRDGILRVYWQSYRRMFDFDEIQIVYATDKDVESFAMQISNDIDSIRRPHYKHMPYRIDPACKLSENTQKLIKHVFEDERVV